MLVLTGLCLLSFGTALRADSELASGVVLPNLIQTIQITGAWQGKMAHVYHVLGRRAGFTSNSVLNDVKEFDNGVAAIPVLTGVEALEIVSTNANDTAAGTGVQSALVTYINNTSNMVQSSPIVTSGTTPVAAGFTALEILWMEANAAGTNGVAVGNIVLRIVAGAVPVEQITAGGNKSLSARFMVPTGFTGYIPYWSAHAINADQDLRLRAQVNCFTHTLTTVYHFIDTAYVPGNQVSADPVPFLKIPAGAKIKVSTIAAAVGATNRVDTDFDIVLIGN